MNTAKVVAIILIVAGRAGLVYQQFSFTKETHPGQDRPARALGEGEGDGERAAVGEPRRDRHRRGAARRGPEEVTRRAGSVADMTRLQTGYPCRAH